MAAVTDRPTEAPGLPRIGTVRRIRRRIVRMLPGFVVGPWRRGARWLSRRMPRGLFGRSLLIIVLPMIVLQTVVAYVFLERHWQLVTRRLSFTVARDVAAVVDLFEAFPDNTAAWQTLSERRLDILVSVLPFDALPPPRPRPLIDLLDQALSDEIERLVGRPYWISIGGNRSDSIVEIRIQLEDEVLRFQTERRNVYASNSHIFIVWMVSVALVLIVVAVLFLRNQIKPIERLADAAERFGRGQPTDDFQPAGAREVRRAAQAFLAMRRRIERQIEQRTTLLAGVSHDLRTVLTRFRLELALLAPKVDTSALESDAAEMEAMLVAYLAFARGVHDEAPQTTDVAALIAEVCAAHRDGAELRCRFEGGPEVAVRPVAFKRMLDNLIGNAVRHGKCVEVAARRAEGWLTVTVDDDGPGVPEAERELVFRPFYRLNAARTLSAGGTGLGLAIARDAARGHGGTIRLEDSPLGGLRVLVRLPG